MALVDYTVSAELELRDAFSPVLDKILERLDKATTTLAKFQERLDRMSSKGLNRILDQLDKLKTASFPDQLIDGVAKFDQSLSGADRMMTDLTKHAAELARIVKDIRVPEMPRVPSPGPVPGRAPGGGHGHGGGDPIMAGIEGGAVLEFLGGNYERYSSVDQVYRAMQSDSALAGPTNSRMAAMRKQSEDQLARYRTLTPLDVAKNAGEAYTIAGGNMDEQPALQNMLDRSEQNLVLRGKSPEDAQRQATAILKGLDIANRFFNPKTGEFDQKRADAENDRVQALVAASGGLMSGQQFLSFEKSAGLAGQRLSLEGEAKLAHMIDINPSRFGTSLKSFENLFGGHATRMAKKDKAAWTAVGLYDKSGLLVDNDLLGIDPLGWIEKHQKQLTAARINDRTQRQNVASMILESQGAQGNTNRQAAAVARQDVTANSQNLLNSPIGKTLQFEASLEKFRVSLGKFEAGPGAMILDKLAGGLDKLTSAMEKHPEAAENLLKFSAALSAFAVARGVVALTGIGDGLGALSRGLSLFGKGAAAETALEGLATTAGAGSLFGLSAGIIALGAAIIGLPPLMRYLLGDKDGSPHMPTNARGHSTANQDPTAPTYATTPQQDMQNYLDSLWGSVQHPQTTNNARGLGSHVSYRTDSDPVHLQPISVTLNVDGKLLTQVVDTHQTRRAQLDGMADPRGFDPVEGVHRPGRSTIPYII